MFYGKPNNMYNDTLNAKAEVLKVNLKCMYGLTLPHRLNAETALLRGTTEPAQSTFSARALGLNLE